MSYWVLGFAIASFLVLVGYGVFCEIDERRWRRYIEESMGKKK